MAENLTISTASEIVDVDAVAIGELYARSQSSFIESVMESVETLIECGRRLAEKKASPSMAHGEWLPWLEVNAGVLGFTTRRTAAMLMKAADKANGKSTSHLDMPTALKLSRQMWGNKGAGNHLAMGTGENEWYTPPEYIAMAREVMGGIDLDPASSAEANKVVGAVTFFNAEADGLARAWVGRVWLNPPYSRDLMPRFVEKLKVEFLSGDVSAANMVTHNNTDTGWFHSLAEVTGAICFPAKRIRFYRGEEAAAPVNGQMFIYLGDGTARFTEVFSSIGFVMVPA